MTALRYLAIASVALGAGMACATSADEASPASPPITPVAPLAPSEGGVDAANEDARQPTPATCSAAGWCVTSLPDADLVLRDIWPIRGRTFAVAESPTLGVKVLAWDDADPRWQYIDDNTQNENGFGKYVGGIWAPNEYEVYFGVAPGYVYRGKRAPSTPATWTWERTQLSAVPSSDSAYDPALPRDDFRALGVWGTADDDVYAWYGNTIFHRASNDGGPPAWVSEYVADDADSPWEHLAFVSMGGSNKDDLWFAGGRGSDATFSCPIVVRKTPDGYRRIVDGAINYDFSAPCVARAETILLGGGGWLTDIQSAGARRFAGLRGGDTVVRITEEEDGSYTTQATTVRMTAPTGAAVAGFYSLWVDDDDAWLSGWGLVLRGPTAADAGEFEVSTVSLSGAPLNRPLFRIRGTANDNLWAIGARNALHKTTP